MKKISLVIFFLMTGMLLLAQTDKQRVAVFDPSASGSMIDEGTVVAVREIISSVLVNNDKYTIVERSLIDQILKEQKISNSGAVDADQISELGKLAGANKVILTVLTSAGQRAVLSIRTVDVESASIESQKTKTVAFKDLLDEVEPLTLSLIGEEVQISTTNTESTASSSRLSRFANSIFKEKNDKEKSDKEKFAERVEEPVFFESSPPSAEFKEVIFEFKGTKGDKNTTVQLYLNGEKIGDGTLNQGFYIKHKNIRPGVYSLKIEWSRTISSTTYSINTNVRQHYEFEYNKTGFGYIFKLKN